MTSNAVESFEVAAAPSIRQSTRQSTGGSEAGRSRGSGQSRISRMSVSSHKSTRRSVMMVPGCSLALDTKANQDPLDDETLGNGLTSTEVVCNFVIACVGCAICVFPKKMDDAGYLPAIPLLALGCISCLECGKLIAEGCRMAEELKDDGTQVADYEAFAMASAGPRWKAFLGASKNGAMLGFIVVFMQFVTDSFASYISPEFRQAHPNTKPFIRFMITLPLHIAMTFIKDLKQLAKFNNLGVLAVFTELCGLVAGAIMHRHSGRTCSGPEDYERMVAKMASLVEDMTEVDPCIWYEPWPDKGTEIDNMGAFLASAVFAFAVLSTIPNLRSQMETPAEMPPTLSRALAIVMAMYAAVMALGYRGYGEGSPGNFAEALANDFPLIGRITSSAILVNSLISAPIFIICVVEAFQNSGTSAIHTAFSFPNRLFRVWLIVCLAVTGFIFSNIGAVISLVSAIFCVCNNIFLPIFFYHSIRSKLASAGIRQDPLSVQRKAFHAMIILVGLFTMVFGVKGAMAAFRTTKKAAETIKILNIVNGSNINGSIVNSSTI